MLAALASCGVGLAMIGDYSLERQSAQFAQRGDVVLLSPGGTSFDAYPNFVVRGEQFRKLVQTLE